MRIDVHLHSDRRLEEEIRAMLRKLDILHSQLDELLQRGKPTKMKLEFGEPEETKGDL